MIFKGENTETGILNLDDLVDHEEAVEALKAKTESRNERFVSNLIEKYIDTGRSESITFQLTVATPLTKFYNLRTILILLSFTSGE